MCAWANYVFVHIYSTYLSEYICLCILSVAVLVSNVCFVPQTNQTSFSRDTLGSCIHVCAWVELGCLLMHTVQKHVLACLLEHAERCGVCLRCLRRVCKKPRKLCARYSVVACVFLCVGRTTSCRLTDCASNVGTCFSGHV